MTQEDYQQLESLYLTKIKKVDVKFVRYLYKAINWDVRLIGIKGARGVGKTTLLLQRIKMAYKTTDTVFYVSLDNLWFQSHTLPELVDWLYLHGIRHLFLDEVHKYPTWSKELKEIIDLWPDLKVTFTGSSLLQILNADADLSRRVLSYDMAGLSFREYLRFYKGIELPSYSLYDILNDADHICQQVCEVCRPQALFEEYLRVGYYPFYDGDEQEYYSRIENVVSFIIDQEMTLFCGVEPAYTRKLKAMLLFLANNIPYDVSIAKLSSYLEINKTTVLSYLANMQRAELVNLLYTDNKSVTKMQKPDKIYLHNPNMLYALSTEEKIGAIRECFVVNQLSTGHTVEYGKAQGDFKIDDKITIEVGEKDKSFDQIADIPDSYVLADSMEFPVGRKLPLWLVGFLY